MQNSYLEFTVSYLEKIGISTHTINIKEPLDDSIDKGLRKTITRNKQDRIASFKELDPNFINEHILYFTEDIYGCHYILIPIPEQELPLVLIAGPYLQEAPGIYKTQELCKKLNIPQGLGSFLTQYFSALPYIDNNAIIELYMETLCEKIYAPGNYKIEYLKQNPDERDSYVSQAESSSNTDTMKQLEHRYMMEEKMMDAISRGDYNAAMHYSSDKAFSALDTRASSTLRSQKNYLFVFNTLCRKAAERGKVHPIYLDEMSRRMSIRIESITSANEDKEVHREILRKYCLLVQQSSTEGHSPVIQKVLNHILLNLPDPSLTLQKTADELSLNKSYLATIFKNEMNATFTTYVNKRRIEHAIFLLNTTDDQIQNIASSCGITDITYFTRIFRREKGMTPSQYRRMIRG